MVVLVHGLVVSSRYMVPTAERLAPHCRVFAPDLPGFGGSEKPPRVLDVAGLSDALSALSLLAIELLDYLSAGTLRSWRTFRYALDDRIEEKLPHMRVPTLVVLGSRDAIYIRTSRTLAEQPEWVRRKKKHREHHLPKKLAFPVQP